MGERTRVLIEGIKDYGAYTLLGAGATGLVGLGAGYIADTFEGRGQEGVLAAAEAELAGATAAVSDFESQLVKQIEAFGAGCVGAITLYADAGPFAGTSEAEMVSDLTGDPCSDDPAEVRTAVGQVIPSQNGLAEAAAFDFDGTRAAIAATQEQIVDDQNQPLAAWGLAAGAALGAAAGIAIAGELRGREKRGKSWVLHPDTYPGKIGPLLDESVPVVRRNKWGVIVPKPLPNLYYISEERMKRIQDIESRWQG